MVFRKKRLEEKFLTKKPENRGCVYLQFLKEETFLEEHCEICVQVILKWCHSTATF